MSQNVEVKLEEEEIELVYDQNQVVFDGSEQYANVVYDGSQAIVVNGQYYIPTDLGAIVCQDNELYEQYIVNNNSENIIFDANESQILETESVENAQIVQYVDDSSNSNQIVYYTEEDGNVLGAQDLNEIDGQVSIINGDENTPFKKLKLGGQIINLDQIFESSSEQTSQDETEYQCMVINDGQLHLEYLDYENQIEENQQSSIANTEENGTTPLENEHVDFSKITGKNLLTGQTVSLNHYIKKLNKKKKFSKALSNNLRVDQNDSESGKKDDLSGLLNRKVLIGKTSKGQKLVGKIVSIKRKSEELEQDKQGEVLAEEVNNTTEEQNFDEIPDELMEITQSSRTIVRQADVKEETLSYIAKTLEHLMDMETVQKKLQHKQIEITLIENYEEMGENPRKTESRLHGRMQLRQDDTILITDPEAPKWRFQYESLQKPSSGGREFKKASILLSITHGRDGGIHSTKLVLNPVSTVNSSLKSKPLLRCDMCCREFKNGTQLRTHKLYVHNVVGKKICCELCGKICLSYDALEEHKATHLRTDADPSNAQEQSELYQLPECNICNRQFTTSAKLKRHMTLIHNEGEGTAAKRDYPLECNVCGRKCASNSSLRKHQLTHTGIKPFKCPFCSKRFLVQGDLNFHTRLHDTSSHYACQICTRTFSKFANLQRHLEIHKKAEDAQTSYVCNICGCTYNYMSSLTRHIVQHHITNESN